MKARAKASAEELGEPVDDRLRLVLGEVVARVLDLQWSHVTCDALEGG
jgi:hypothetical protein